MTRAVWLSKLVCGEPMPARTNTPKTRSLLLEELVFQTTMARVLTVETSIVRFTLILNTRELVSLRSGTPLRQREVRTPTSTQLLEVCRWANLELRTEMATPTAKLTERITSNLLRSYSRNREKLLTPALHLQLKLSSSRSVGTSKSSSTMTRSST